ncbi:glutathione S-transferase [Polymorphobacter multimanifer]|uniref:Glutathione S-transferase n=1 Tax=Polymorphobacter multimanifer TaxID=1070431 RepID=A0A841L754_9SPHN|nr:glutathione S-transferase family protein [Polymorphobacter multimanifer]MBB6228260.1 glutathione S-transferase [Polymorphobacter multimanifer]GGI85743.1 glutathione S-transferase [Polymorphobacter multimanifer]
MSHLTLYTNPQSRGMIAHWMLAELGQPFELVNLDYGTTMKAPDYLAINPMGKVPALVHRLSGREVVVTEAAAICAYLAEAFADAGLLPDMTGRAAYFRWMFFCAGPMEAAIMDRHMKVEVSDEQKVMVGYGRYDEAVAALAGAMPTGDEWISGSQFTAADVYVGATVSWGLQFGTLPEQPEFRAYFERLKKRPAYLKVFSEMPAS